MGRYFLTRDLIVLPNDRINVVFVEVPQMEAKLRETLGND